MALFPESPPQRPISLKIDHVSICGPELGLMQQAFADFGLRPDYGGRHATSFTHMALLGFDDGTYIELIAPVNPAKPASEGEGWSILMGGNAGPCAWAVIAPDVNREVERVSSLGIPVGRPAYGNRKKPDGTLIEWATARIGPGEEGSTLPFLIEDRTPRAYRAQPSPSIKGTGLMGLEMVVLGVKNLESAIAMFHRVYGWPAPQTKVDAIFGARLACFTGTPVTLASPLPGHRWLSDRLARFGDLPWRFLLGASDIEAASKPYHPNRLTPWFGRQVVWFDPDKLNGARLGIIESSAR